MPATLLRNRMSLLSLEHSAAAYRLDFALYAVLCLASASTLLAASPQGTGAALVLWVLGGMALWSLLEYLLHRHVLHGLAPFSHWHAQHHLRPKALIASPTVLSLSLFVLLGSLPAWWLLGAWAALALTLGLLTSYLLYGLTHHLSHHGSPAWLRRSAWISQRRVRHAMHHAAHHIAARGDTCKPCHFGVSSSVWDTVFGTNTRLRSFQLAPPVRAEP
jgi:cyclopropane-fatty-acyl-phospholipid synthase